MEKQASGPDPLSPSYIPDRDKEIVLDPIKKKQLQDAAEWLKVKVLEREFFLAYNKKVITLVFVTVFISNIWCNVDHGTLPGGAGPIS